MKSIIRRIRLEEKTGEERRRLGKSEEERRREERRGEERRGEERRILKKRGEERRRQETGDRRGLRSGKERGL